MSHSHLPPTLVIHADWGKDPKKRWMARASLSTSGSYRAEAPEPVGQALTPIDPLVEHVASPRAVLIGFDFPIGLPIAYARAAEISQFLPVLAELGQGRWSRFFDVAQRPGEISLERPFYPMRPGGTRQEHLLSALSLPSMDALRRRCEMPRPGRRAACPLFWTLGGQQVGKAAIAGWREVLIPALQSRRTAVKVWPFSGLLEALLRDSRVVVAETYPAEFYDHLGIEFGRHPVRGKSGKRVREDRAAQAETLLRWASEAGVELSEPLRSELKDGFGTRTDGEDRFDAVVGLFGMLNVVLGRREPGEPNDDEVLRIEGWILGQRS